MKRSNLIPITKIYDIYPKYTYSDDVKKFMDEIVDIDRDNVYSKDEVISILEELKTDIEKNGIVDFEETYVDDGECIISVRECNRLIQEKINVLIGKKDGKRIC